METYCGKNCETCTWREPHQCPGCQSGPGRAYGGDCDIARCCREKGHTSCATCTMASSGCTKWSGRESVPAVRQNLKEIKAAREAEAAAQAPALGKWLWVMFWLVIPANVASLMSHESVVEIWPALQIPGEILAVLCNIIYGFALLRLKDIREQYRTAGVLTMVTVLLSAVTHLIPEGRSGLLLLVSLPVLAVSLPAEYHEYMAHASVLEGVATELSEQWKTLWKWYIGLLLAVLGGLFVMLLIPILGVLAILAAAIGVLVISILKLVYLYRTAKLFRQWGL